MSVYEKMASAMPPLSHVECLKCGRRLNMLSGEAARFLANGWPSCHGQTMRLFTVAEEAKRARGPRGAPPEVMSGRLGGEVQGESRQAKGEVDEQ